MIDLSPEHLAEVRAILARQVPECSVLVFGSRVTGRARPYSDLDLAVVASASLGLQKMARLREAFAESTLPFRVDVLDWHAIPTSFRTVITERHEPLPLLAPSHAP